MDTYKVKTYQLLYFKYEEFTVCQSYLNKTAKNKKNSHSVVAISCLCWLRRNFGMEYFLVMDVYFRIPKSFPDNLCSLIQNPILIQLGIFTLVWILRMILVQHLLSFDSPSSLGTEFFIPFKSISAITCYYCLISPTSKTQIKYNYNANLIVYC